MIKQLDFKKIAKENYVSFFSPDPRKPGIMQVLKNGEVIFRYDLKNPEKRDDIPCEVWLPKKPVNHEELLSHKYNLIDMLQQELEIQYGFWLMKKHMNMSKFVIITWPHVQNLMDYADFHDNSYLIADPDWNDVGNSAYFVREDWVENLPLKKNE